jgi:hypothetical protein
MIDEYNEERQKLNITRRKERTWFRHFHQQIHFDYIITSNYYSEVLMLLTQHLHVVSRVLVTIYGDRIDNWI